MGKSIRFSEYLTKIDLVCKKLASNRGENERFRKLQEFRQRPTDEIVRDLIKELNKNE